jgi:hypothetical protein
MQLCEIMKLCTLGVKETEVSLKQTPMADLFQDGNEVIYLLRPIASHGSSQKCGVLHISVSVIKLCWSHVM